MHTQATVVKAARCYRVRKHRRYWATGQYGPNLSHVVHAHDAERAGGWPTVAAARDAVTRTHYAALQRSSRSERDSLGPVVYEIVLDDEDGLRVIEEITKNGDTETTWRANKKRHAAYRPRRR